MLYSDDINFIVYGFMAGFVCSFMGWAFQFVISQCNRAVHHKSNDKWE